MARARNIKPGFFSNEELVELPFATRLLFIGLWTVADRAGRLEDKPKKIKMALFPADEVDVDSALESLHKSGFLLRYEHEGAKFIQVLAFEKHQNPHKDEKKSVLPAPNLQGTCTVQQPTLNGTCHADSPIPDSPIPDCSTKSSPTRQKPAPSEDIDFEEAYALYPSRPGSSKQGALKAWRKRIADGVDPKAMVAGVKRYSAYVGLARTEPNFIKMPATFFGPDRHFDSDWTHVPQSRAGPPGYQSANDKAKTLADRLTGKTRNEQPDQRIIDLNAPP